SASLMYQLFFYLPLEVPWFWLVGWFQCLARSHPDAVQRDRSRDPGTMELPVSFGGNINLPARIWISVLDLGQADSKDLGPQHMWNACRRRPDDGNVSFFPDHDRAQCGGVRVGIVSRRGKTDQFTTSNGYLMS